MLKGWQYMSNYIWAHMLVMFIQILLLLPQVPDKADLLEQATGVQVPQAPRLIGTPHVYWVGRHTIPVVYKESNDTLMTNLFTQCCVLYTHNGWARCA